MRNVRKIYMSVSESRGGSLSVTAGVVVVVAGRYFSFLIWDNGSTIDIFTKDHSLTHLMNYEGVCKTALSTPGLLTTPGVLKMVLVSLSTHIEYFPCARLYFNSNTPMPPTPKKTHYVSYVTCHLSPDQHSLKLQLL